MMKSRMKYQMPEGQLIYQMPAGQFEKINKLERKMAFYFYIPLLILLYFVLVMMFLDLSPDDSLADAVITALYLGCGTFILVYIGNLSSAIKHKRLKIYSNGIVPSIIPFWDLTTKDVFIPYNKIARIDLIEHPKFKDLYAFEIHHENGKVYEVNSKWLYQYKIPTKDIKKIKDYLMKIKEALEESENIEKKREGKEIVLFEAP